MVRMDEAIRTRCCIAGGGPAGMMLALVLARMGEEDNTTNGRNYLGWYGKLPTDRGTAANWPIALQPSTLYLAIGSSTDAATRTAAAHKSVTRRV